MARGQGKDFLIYLGSGAPSSAFYSSDAAYALAAHVVNSNITKARNPVDTSSKDDGYESTFVSGRRVNVVSGTMRFDKVAATGYTKLKTVYEAAAGTVWFLVTSDVIGDTEWSGSGMLTQFDVTMDDETVMEVAFSIQVTGAISEAVTT